MQHFGSDHGVINFYLNKSRQLSSTARQKAAKNNISSSSILHSKTVECKLCRQVDRCNSTRHSWLSGAAAYVCGDCMAELSPSDLALARTLAGFRPPVKIHFLFFYVVRFLRNYQVEG